MPKTKTRVAASVPEHGPLKSAAFKEPQMSPQDLYGLLAVPDPLAEPLPRPRSLDRLRSLSRLT
jgi:hypothetical protein